MIHLRRSLLGLIMSLLALAATDNTLAPHRANVVLLAFRANTPASVQNTILASAGATVTKRLGTGALMVTIGNNSVTAAIRQLLTHREVLYAEPDYASLPIEGSHVSSVPVPSVTSIRTGLSAQGFGNPLPNDPSVTTQWAVQNNGQSVNGVSGTPGADERAASAWGVSTGSNSVVVAVLDSGVQYTHPDLVRTCGPIPAASAGAPRVLMAITS